MHRSRKIGFNGLAFAKLTMMNTPTNTSASTPNNMATKIVVWDRIVRLGHWVLVVSFIVAYASAESERWRLVHVSSGCLVFAAVVMRVVWGVIGTHHARFVSFISAPKRAITYLKSLATPRPEHHTGHNPAGGWAVVGLLGLSLLASITGWMAYNNVGGAKLGQWHELASNLALALVIVHVAAVVISSYLHKENLWMAMLTGFRQGQLSERIQDVGFMRVGLYFVILGLLAYAAKA
jgi:cytochrome b